MLFRTRLFFAAFLCLGPFQALAAETQEVEVDFDHPQRLDARYRLFKTRNVWNFVELDTQTGRVWQVQFSVRGDESRLRVPINTDALAKDGKPGRFTIYPTRNTYNFLLLDQESGKVWQVQFATDGARGIWPIEQPQKAVESEWKQ